MKICILYVIIFTGNLYAQSIIYVDSSISTSGLGNSWANAYKTLKEATLVANGNLSIKEIHIAKGTYYPTTNTNRDSTFLISRGDIRLIGGFPSGGGTRNFLLHPTILSGDIGSANVQTDNSHHVLVIAGIDFSADSIIISGLNIRWGRAANVSGSFTYNEQSIARTSGGGIALKNNANGRKIKITNCNISGNYAGNTGAGIYIENAQPEIRTCIFSGNYADYGGAAFNYLNAETYYINCTFAGNHDNHGGGGMRNSSSTPILRNCIIYGNNGGISNNNATFGSFESLIQGLTSTANGNLNGVTNDPLFETPIATGTVNIDGDYRLQTGSPCLNVGNSSFFLGSELDLDNKPRKYGPSVDLGSYERQDCPTNLVPPTPNVDTFQFFCGNHTVLDLLPQGIIYQWYNVPSGGTPLSVSTVISSGTYYISQETYGCIGPRKSVSVNLNLPIRYVRQGGSGNKSGSSWANASDDLQLMINESCENSEIRVAAGTYYPNRQASNLNNIIQGNAMNAFVLKPNVKILGGFPPTGNPSLAQRNWNTHSTILSGDLSAFGGNRSYHVVISTGDVGNAELNGFTITKGNSSSNFTIYVNGHAVEAYSGGGVFISNSNPTLNNCTILENNASELGGGIYINNSSSNINNCAFSRNSSSNKGGGMYKASSNLLINDCSFRENTAIDGGGVYNRESSSTFNTCLFSKNTATGDGGGMYNTSNSSPTLNFCNISENHARNGSGIYGSYGFNSLIKNCTISGNIASYSGGGIYNSLLASPTIINCIISGNKAVDLGGGVCNDGSYQPKIINSTISGNSANYGGGVYLSEFTTFNTKNCIIWGNSSEIYDPYLNIAVTNSIVKGGQSGVGNLNQDPLFTNAPSSSIAPFTGGDYSILLACSPMINNGNNNGIPSNTTTDIVGNPRIYESLIDIGPFEFQSAKLYVPSITTEPIQTDCSVPNVSFSITTQNTITYSWQVDTGSGFNNISNNTFYSGANTATLNISNPSVAMNGYLYRVVLTGSCSPNIISKTVAHFFTKTRYVTNPARGNRSGGSWANASGDLQKMINESCENSEIWVARGFYYPNRPSNNLNEIDVENRNNAFVLKQNVKIYGGFPNTGNPDMTQRNWVTNATYLSGNIPIFGYGKYYHVVISSGNVGTAELNGFTITEGNADGDGSVYYVNGDYISSKRGGGMFISNSSPILNNISFSTNLASEYGAGLFISNSSSSLTNCSFNRNFADNSGGGIYNKFSNTFLSNCSFVDNRSTSGLGGGVYTESSSPTFTSCTFTYNSAPNGGGIANISSSTTFTHCKFSRNYCEFSGGGIFNWGNTSKIYNCVFSGNKANSYGGALYAQSLSLLDIRNTTISGNAAGYGSGGIYNSASNIEIKNSILHGNEGGVFTTGGSTINVNNSIIQSWGSGNINPMFINAQHYSSAPYAEGDLRLLTCSPAINGGDNSHIPLGMTTDFNGNPRINSISVDMGAYENEGYLLNSIANTSLIANNNCETPDGWTHFSNHDDDEEKIIVSIKKNGQNLGNINASASLNENYGLSSTLLQLPYGQIKNYIPFNRSWALESEHSFGNPVNVRFYFNEQDSSDIASLIPIDSISKLILYKVDGNDVWNTQSTGYKEYIFGAIPDTFQYVFGEFQGIRFVEFQTNSFSTGTLAMTIEETILPLDLLQFTASAIGEKSFIQWHTVNEVNVSHFEIERCNNVQKWEKISNISALNGIEQHYNIWDDQPFPETNYYRIKMIDLDGTFKYSNIVAVTFEKGETKPQYLIFPNPNNGLFNIQLSEPNGISMQIELFDGFGRLMYQDNIIEGDNYIYLNHLASGIYYLNIRNPEGNSVHKIAID